MLVYVYQFYCKYRKKVEKKILKCIRIFGLNEYVQDFKQFMKLRYCYLLKLDIMRKDYELYFFNFIVGIVKDRII